MQHDMLAQLAGFVTLFLMVISYFFKSKRSYLLCQMLGSCAMFFSYVFSGEYFAMLALTVSFSRTLVFFLYEKNDKNAPLWWSFLFGGLTILAYGIMNIVILGTAKPVDILYLTAQVMYAFIFRIRNIKTVRYTITIPHTLAVCYNLLLDDMLFVAMSYGFEWLANLFAIFKNRNEPHVLETEECNA